MALINFFRIIAVHGLGADPEHTWSCRNPAGLANGSNRTHLLRHLLQNDFPQARICSYEYDSSWLGDAPAKTTEEIGLNLLDELKLETTRSQPVGGLCEVFIFSAWLTRS